MSRYTKKQTDIVSEVESDEAERSEETLRTERVYKGTQEVDHDLFKLEIAPMLKNVSFSEEQPRYEQTEHVHWFHTVDSMGQPMKHTPAVGGHFHEIILVPDANGGVPRAMCSPPMKWVRAKGANGRMQRVAIELEHDHHTHTLNYHGSEKFKIRNTVNTEFAKLQAALEAKKPGPVEGIKG